MPARSPGRAARVLTLPTLHFRMCGAIQLEWFGRAEWSGWFWAFLFDLPLSTILSFMPLPPFVVFGVAGTLWWYWISRAMFR